MPICLKDVYVPSAEAQFMFVIATIFLRAYAWSSPLDWPGIQEQCIQKSSSSQSVEPGPAAQARPSTTQSTRPASGPHAPASNSASPGAGSSSVDLRPRLLELGFPPRPQGARGTCSIFTTCAAIEFAVALQSGSPRRLSPEFLNWAASQAGGRPSDGNFFHNALAGFEAHGICAETSMPYLATFDAGCEPARAALAEAKELLKNSRLGIDVHWIVPWVPDRFGVNDEQFAEIRRVIALGYPIAAGSGHSRLLVGYRDEAEKPGGGVFITEDSALNRFDEVTYEFVRKQVADVFWIEAVESTKVTVPTPQSRPSAK